MSKVQVDNIVNKTDTGAPNFPKGLTVTGIATMSSGMRVTGVVTATSFVGSGAELTGIIAGVTTSKAVGLNFFFGY